MIIFSAQVFFGSIWGPKQLGQIWGRSLVTPLSALRLTFVWKLVWENLLFCIFTPRGKSFAQNLCNQSCKSIVQDMLNNFAEDCEAIRCSWKSRVTTDRPQICPSCLGPQTDPKKDLCWLDQVKLPFFHTNSA